MRKYRVRSHAWGEGIYAYQPVVAAAESADEETSGRYNLRLSVLPEQDYPELAISQTERPRSSMPDASSGSGNPGRCGPPQNPLNNRMDSVINEYGAFLNQADALGNSGR